MTETIHDLPSDDRPRERLLRHGAATLSDAELLAILIGTGVRGRNALQLARDLLSEGFEGLCRREVGEISRMAGLGPAKAARIAAALEAGRRALRQSAPVVRKFDPSVQGPELVASHAHFAQEHVGALYLDSRDQIVAQRDIFVGTLAHALVSTRDIVRLAIIEHACGVALYHNHPSGNPSPSAQDLEFTRKVKEALRLVDVELIDHLIVGRAGYVSLRDRGFV